jgi:hypothetical protein
MRMLSPEERTKLGIKAAATRWANYRAAKAAQQENRGE